MLLRPTEPNVSHICLHWSLGVWDSPITARRVMNLWLDLAHALSGEAQCLRCISSLEFDVAEVLTIKGTREAVPTESVSIVSC